MRKVDELSHLVRRYELQVDGIWIEGSATDNVLALRDKIEETLQTLSDGVRVQRLRERVVQADELLKKQKRIVVSNLVNPAHYRRVLKPDRSRWWWFLDEMVAEEERQRMERTLAQRRAATGKRKTAALSR